MGILYLGNIGPQRVKFVYQSLQNTDQQVPTSLATTDTKSDALRADPHATPVTDEFIQCNEVSSSDDETSVMHNAPSKISAAKIVFGVSSSGNKSLKTILKETRSSRELNALQLDSPNFTSNYKNLQSIRISIMKYLYMKDLRLY